MKTFFKILLVIIVVIVAAMFIIPLAFHNKIAERAKEEVNKNIDAKVEFADYSLSLFRNFPNFSLKLENLTVDGQDAFDGYRMADIPALLVSIDLLSVLRGGPYEIEKILIDKPDVYLVVLKDGSANWDIGKVTGKAQQSDTEGQPEDFALSIKNFQINNGKLLFKDKTSDVDLRAEGLNYTLSGDLSADATTLKIKTKINELTFKSGGIDYLFKNELNIKADFEADLKNSIYTLKNNRIEINALILEFFGSVAQVEEGTDFLITFKAPRNDFKNILSLIPAIYSKDFDNIKTGGKLSLDGSIKGMLTDSRSPSYDVRIKVEDGMFRYPDLPEEVNDININATFTNKTGDPDNILIDIPTFNCSMAGNPVNISMKLSSPVSDPHIDGQLNGKLDLASIGKLYPLDSTEKLGGVVTADISLNGKLSSIEEEKYEDFEALGSLLIKKLEYRSENITEGITIDNAQLNFAPAYIDLVTLKLGVGKSHLEAKGKITEYLGYFISDGMLKGNFSASSDYLDLDQFMTGKDQPTEPDLSDTVEFKAFRVPVNIDFMITTSFQKLKYDQMLMENVHGIVEIKNETATLHSLDMNVFGGKMTLNGCYSTIAGESPLIKFELDLQDFGISQAATSFSLLNTYAPFAKHLAGNFSGNINFTSILGEDLMPVYSTLNGNGGLKTSKLKVEGVNTLNSLAESLSLDGLRSMDLNRINISFDIEEGKLNVKPFKLKLGEIDASIGGWTNFNQSINYDLDLKVPTDIFGGGANNALNSLIESSGFKANELSLGESVTIAAVITGTAQHPEINTTLSNLVKNLGKDVKKKVEETIEEKKEEAIEKLNEEKQKIIDDANKKAQELIQQAEAQASVITNEAQKAAGEIRSEANKQAEQLIREGKKKGAVAEIAAKRAADKIKDEADDKVNQLINEADVQAQGIINNAKAEAGKIVKGAEEKVK